MKDTIANSLVQFAIDKNLKNVPSLYSVSADDVYSADLFHPAYNSYEVLVKEDGVVRKYIVLYDLDTAPFTHVHLKCCNPACPK